MRNTSSAIYRTALTPVRFEINTVVVNSKRLILLKSSAALFPLSTLSCVRSFFFPLPFSFTLYFLSLSLCVCVCLFADVCMAPAFLLPFSVHTDFITYTSNMCSPIYHVIPLFPSVCKTSWLLVIFDAPVLGLEP